MFLKERNAYFSKKKRTIVRKTNEQASKLKEEINTEF